MVLEYRYIIQSTTHHSNLRGPEKIEFYEKIRSFEKIRFGRYSRDEVRWSDGKSVFGLRSRCAIIRKYGVELRRVD